MHNDQAAGLRAMQSSQTSAPVSEESAPKKTSGRPPKPVRVLAVASGKGGVGKTNVSVNLSVSLAQLGNRVLLMDADMGLANVDIMLGLQTKYNLAHVLDGEKTLREVMVDAPGGIKVIPAASGVKRMAQLSTAENAGIINAFSEIDGFLDILVIDTAAGIADSVVSFCRASQDVIVVVNDEPASMTDAYALIKVLSKEYNLTKFKLLANMVRTEKHGLMLYDKFSKVCEQFLDVYIDYLGTVPFDHDLREAIQRQTPVTIAKPNSESAKAFRKIAAEINNWPIPTGITGYLQFFVERLFQSQNS
ncbi:MinD/ParA family protein [Hydrogenovibrio marinus]|uniref:Cobyrinic acid a,c-diamide synthase n=1 Tax=Hydrogenovibrio marinus TaxID=28885 RepID=A0A066ZWR8_HYDMR|nr:MinD/ParA family protein [Hydrogenovibrio marinus]KDN94796.1 cobyrinic acid a,c-diamide synthase [Hydrogenovibrio marinus]BBN59254.1 site-determining protein [Hydrogenovibrio marinus]